MLDNQTRTNVLNTMAGLLEQHAKTLLSENRKDIDTFVREDDIAMYDRLVIDAKKVEGMIASLHQLANLKDPLHIERFSFTHDNGLQISNKTTAFGTVLIIYESRPDVTIEAGGIAFKSGNRILLKGGKEAIHSNTFLVHLWKTALKDNKVNENWIEYLNYNRTETQEFLKHPHTPVDLIIPRGGEKLIAFVKQHATAPVIVSGRGNNFVYVDKDCDTTQALDIIINAKTAKISACNALDKVLIHKDIPKRDTFIAQLITTLLHHNVKILGDDTIMAINPAVKAIPSQATWREEFLDLKIVVALTDAIDDAVQTINTYSGGHSASICTTNTDTATYFMNAVDAAAVYHNASTRFTDGFQFGLGGELAISTDKLHQRGPIGLQHLVTNKWYITGHGQTR